MYRTAEWLLLPLFLLPLGVGIGFHLWADSDYRSHLATYVQDGAAQAQRWLGDDGIGPAVVRDHDSWVQRRLRSSPGAHDLLVRLGDREARLAGAWPASVSMPARTWIGSEAYPSGMTARALADARVRLSVQMGHGTETRPPEDDVSLAFRTLLAEPHIQRLAETALPAATKQYLVARWIEKGVTIPQLPAVARALALIERVEAFLARPTDPLVMGVHEREGLTVMVGPGGTPLFHPPVPEAPLDAPMSAGPGIYAGPSELVLLQDLGSRSYAPLAAVLWQGRLEAPLAGNWAFLRRYGERWWSAPIYARWIGPVLAALLAFLLLPTALLVSLRRQRRLDEARTRFVNEMAHDLRTPLTSLRLHAEMLEGGAADPAQMDRYARNITRESARMTALLANLLDLSRLEDGRRRLHLEDVDLASVVRAGTRDFTLLYPDRAADLSVQGPPGLRARADRQALARCLANLLDNAGKHTNPGVAIRVQWRQEGREVVLRVEDRGPGLPPKERGPAFERYGRGTRARRDGLPGSGLGLALVKDLLTELQGSVRWVSSKTGATIEMRVPLGGSE